MEGKRKGGDNESERGREKEREQTDGRADGRITGYFSKIGQITPSPTLPRRKLALPRGRRLHNGLRDVGVATPSSSPGQPHCGSQASCYFQRQGSCSTSYASGTHASSRNGEGALSDVCYLRLVNLGAHIHALCRNRLRLNRFH